MTEYMIKIGRFIWAYLYFSLYAGVAIVLLLYPFNDKLQLDFDKPKFTEAAMMLVANITVSYLLVRKFGLRTTANEVLKQRISFKNIVLLWGINFLIVLMIISSLCFFGEVKVNHNVIDITLIVEWFFMLTALAFMEEFLFRVLLLEYVDRTLLGVLLSSFAFMLFHLFNPNVTIVSCCNIFLFGCLLGLIYCYYRNPYIVTVIHASWNFTCGIIAGTNVSGLALKGINTTNISGPEIITGGAFGIEGSIITTLVLMVVTAWAFFKIKQERL